MQGLRPFDPSAALRISWAKDKRARGSPCAEASVVALRGCRRDREPGEGVEGLMSERPYLGCRRSLKGCGSIDILARPRVEEVVWSTERSS